MIHARALAIDRLCQERPAPRYRSRTLTTREEPSA